MERIIADVSAADDKEALNQSTSSKKTSRRTHILSSQRFLVFVLLVAVFDMLLATTELACDVLAETYETDAVCETDNALGYLSSKYGGHLDSYFGNHSIEYILKDVQGLTRQKRMARNVLDVSQRPTMPPATTLPPLRTADSSSSQQTTAQPSPEIYTHLYSISHIFGYSSSAIIISTFLINILRIATLKRTFFHSKLQVLDALIVCICLPVDLTLFPVVWNSSYTLANATAVPILFDVLSRSIRVVINSLINVHAQDQMAIKEEAQKLKVSEKKQRHFKRHARRLRELAKRKGASIEQIIACIKIVKRREDKLKKTNLTSAIMSVNRLLFFGAPELFPHPSKHKLDEKYLSDVERRFSLPGPLPIVSEPKLKEQFKATRKSYSYAQSLVPSMDSFESDDDGLDDITFDEPIESDVSESEDSDSDSLDKSDHLYKSRESIITYM